MTLAEALMERASLKTKISEISSRIKDNILVQEDSEPTENPEELMRELDDAIMRLEALIVSINQTNSQTVIDGLTLTAMIAKRDMLTLKYHHYSHFASTARNITSRSRNTEIKIFSCVDYKKVQSQVDRTAKELRELEAKIQKANWNTELIES